MKCKGVTEVFSRTCGYYRPITQWNKGLRRQYSDRKMYVIQESPREGAEDALERAEGRLKGPDTSMET